MDKIRILLADDHAIMRDGIRALLSTYDDIEIIGEASDGQEALDKAAELLPDVAVIDIGMPKVDGIEATRRIIKTNQKTKVLILTQHDNMDYVLTALKAGATGYLTKRAIGVELVSAIRTVRRGESYLYPSAATAVVKDYVKTSGSEPGDGLTGREREVLKLIADGHTSREISGTLSVSFKTVQGHRANIMKKLDIHNRATLIKYAIHKRLVNVEA